MAILGSEIYNPSPEALTIMVSGFSQDFLTSHISCTFDKKCAVENLNDLMLSSEELLEKFGSPEEFLDTLRTYVDFPGSSSFFQLPKTDAYFCGPVMMYNDLAGATYIYKKDVFPCLQLHCITEINLEQWEAELAAGLLSLYLKTQEEKIDGTEMIEMEERDFDDFRTSVKEINQWISQEPTDLDLMDGNIEDLAIEFIDRFGIEDRDEKTLVDLLERFNATFRFEENPLGYTKVFNWVKSIVGTMDVWMKQIIDQRCKNESIPVRLLEFENEWYALPNELLHWMNIGGLDVPEFVEECLTYADICELLSKEACEKIKFVLVHVNDGLFPALAGAHLHMKDGYFVVQTCEVQREFQEEEEPVKNKKKKKNSRAAKKKVTIQAKPAEKESEACPKCYRASFHTRESNGKLRLEKIETKALKKRVLELEVENIKKDERIRMLEEQKEHVMAEHEKNMEEMQKQLEDMKENAADLEAAISQAAGTTAEPSPVDVAPPRSSEETEKVRNVLFKLLEIRSIYIREVPIPKVLQMTNKLMRKTDNPEVRRRARLEIISYRQDCEIYSNAVESNLAMIRANQQITVDQIPELPDFPTIPKWFQDVYKEIMKEEVPKFCQSLVKVPEFDPNELVDKDCLICLDPMDLESDTTKCECCKRRYHNGCIKEWFKTKRLCPTCNSGLLDDQEFPAIS